MWNSLASICDEGTETLLEYSTYYTTGVVELQLHLVCKKVTFYGACFSSNGWILYYFTCAMSAHKLMLNTNPKTSFNSHIEPEYLKLDIIALTVALRSELKLSIYHSHVREIQCLSSKCIIFFTRIVCFRTVIRNSFPIFQQDHNTFQIYYCLFGVYTKTLLYHQFSGCPNTFFSFCMAYPVTINK